MYTLQDVRTFVVFAGSGLDPSGQSVGGGAGGRGELLKVAQLHRSPVARRTMRRATTRPDPSRLPVADTTHLTGRRTSAAGCRGQSYVCMAEGSAPSSRSSSEDDGLVRSSCGAGVDGRLRSDALELAEELMASWLRQRHRHRIPVI